mmetsp:Transcript_25864/g.65784  ORF Transcript_25864/g.65784 Transcript_25864/m.65784 type:complete len:208 (-) Transcript_25864:242-865(-)
MACGRGSTSRRRCCRACLPTGPTLMGLRSTRPSWRSTGQGASQMAAPRPAAPRARTAAARPSPPTALWGCTTPRAPPGSCPTCARLRPRAPPTCPQPPVAPRPALCASSSPPPRPTPLTPSPPAPAPRPARARPCSTPSTWRPTALCSSSCALRVARRCAWWCRRTVRRQAWPATLRTLLWRACLTPRSLRPWRHLWAAARAAARRL